jgi:hypothetical protein
MNTAAAMYMRSFEAAKAAFAITGYRRRRNGTTPPASGGTTISDEYGKSRGRNGRGDGRVDPRGPIGSRPRRATDRRVGGSHFREYGFEYGSLEEAFNHATSVFGDHHVAVAWLEAALPGVHANTHRVESTAAAIAQAESDPELARADYEIRVLRIPALYFIGLRLKNEQSELDVLIPLTRRLRHSRPAANSPRRSSSPRLPNPLASASRSTIVATLHKPPHCDGIGIDRQNPTSRVKRSA